MWYRIFCRDSAVPQPAALIDHLRQVGLRVTAEFDSDESCAWQSGAIQIGSGSPLYVERFRTAEDDLRNDLNSWAAWLETATWSPHSETLMERIIQTQQLYTLRKPLDHADEVRLDRLCLELCRYLSQISDGIYQIDDDGWFDADGSLLVKEY